MEEGRKAGDKRRGEWGTRNESLSMKDDAMNAYGNKTDEEE